MIFSIGFYFPQFYLQLDAISHNLDPSFSFYSVFSFISVLFSVTAKIIQACGSKLLQRTGTGNTRVSGEYLPCP